VKVKWSGVAAFKVVCSGIGSGSQSTMQKIARGTSKIKKGSTIIKIK
jgi:hypothetical protein